MWQDEIQKHVRFNFTVNILDGAFYGIGALGLASFVTVIPLFLNSLGASTTLIGLVTSLHAIGWQMPQLFTANRVAKMRQYKPFILFMTFHERWPFILRGVGHPQSFKQCHNTPGFVEGKAGLRFAPTIKRLLFRLRRERQGSEGDRFSQNTESPQVR